MLTRLLGNEANLTLAATAVAVVLALAWLVAHLVARVARTVFLAVAGQGQEVSFRAPIVRRPVRVVWAVTFLLITATLVLPALEAAGVRVGRGLSLQALVDWLLKSGLHVALIVLLAYAATRVLGVIVGNFELKFSQGTGPERLEQAKRARTLGTLIRNVVNAAVFALAGLMVLHEFEIDILPILTGAGIAGLAVGFGAQTLVRDVIGGFFLILENQVRVGDVAEVNGTSGLVEAITLRTIVLRDLSGTVHVFPNGSVSQMSNRTRDFSYYLIDVGVAYKEDTDAVVEVMTGVATDLAADPAFAPSLLAPIEVLGVDAFEDSQVTIKARLKTVPLKQWDVGREYRRRLKKAFDAKGIEIPFPHVSLYFGDASRPIAVTMAAERSGRAARSQD